MKKVNWKKKLTAGQYRVLRKKWTEMPFTSKLLNQKESGMYACAACDAELFSSKAKFDSGTGWPSFDEPANKKNIVLEEDTSHGTQRIEVLCKNCKSHLGHVFPDGPTSTREHYCINGCAMNFKKIKIMKKNLMERKKNKK